MTAKTVAFLVLMVGLLIFGTLLVSLLLNSYASFTLPVDGLDRVQEFLFRLVPFDAAKGEEGVSVQGAILIGLLVLIGLAAWRGLGQVHEGYNRWTWISLGLIALTLLVAAARMEPKAHGLEIALRGKLFGVVLTMAVLARMARRYFEAYEIQQWLWETWRFVRQIFPLLVVGVFAVGIIRHLIRPEWVQAVAGANTIFGNLAGVVFGVFMYFPTLVELPIAKMFLSYENPGSHPGRYPVIPPAELPFLVDKPGPASQALDAWYRQYAEREMKDVKVCLTHLHVGTIHSKTAITDPAQIKGMKIRPANGTVGQMVSTLGGTSVQVSAPEARDALEKGVADAITFPWNSIISFGIDKATRFHTDMRLYAAVFVWAMDKPFYEGLSANQKKVIDNHCNNEWAARFGKDWGDAEDGGREKLIAMGGHTIVPMSRAQIDAWKKAVAPVYDEWVAGAGKAGIDGKKALDDLKAQMAKTGGAY